MLPARQVKENAIRDERTRINAAINAQIAIIRDRINHENTSDQLKLAWTIALIEIDEIAKAVNR